MEDREVRKTVNVWCEGYNATGNASPARLIGTVQAFSFEDACRQLLDSDDTFDHKRLTLWGCRLFDNEADAREVFG